MRYINIILLISIFVLSGVIWSNWRQRNELPDISVVGGAIYDVGIISPHHPVVHTFKIINPHPFAITLSTPSPGCSCTTVSATSSVIAAHASTDVTLHIDAEDGNLTGSTSLVTMHGDKRSETWLVVNGKVATSSRS